MSCDGNITQVDTEEGNWQYGYDRLSRLTKATPPDGFRDSLLPAEQYTYDAVGNRTSSLHQPGVWRYNADNQLTARGMDASATEYVYDANGHLIAQTSATGGRTYRYDAAGRLGEVSDNANGSIARYQYDPMGRRISKTLNGQTIWYLHTREGLIAEYDQQGQLQVAYGYKPDTVYGTAPLWQAQTGSTHKLDTARYHYLHTDHLGTPQLATDRYGNVTWKGVLEPVQNLFRY